LHFTQAGAASAAAVNWKALAKFGPRRAVRSGVPKDRPANIKIGATMRRPSRRVRRASDPRTLRVKQFTFVMEDFSFGHFETNKPAPLLSRRV
jgi:hypothetical protein